MGRGQGLRLIAVGLIGGGLAALGLTRLMKNLLFGIRATDPVTFMLIAVVLVSVALLTCWLPAQRTTKVAPLVALRYD